MRPEVAIELCDTILSLCEQLPEKAEEFKEGVTQRTQNLRDWIEENERCTGPQARALQNIEEGVRAWLPDS